MRPPSWIHPSLRHTRAHGLHRHRPAPTPPGPVSLADHDPADTSGFDGAQERGARRRCAELGEELADLQERMYADAYTGGSRRVLVVLQGMDTSGKGGVIDHALGLLSPNGLRLTSFKKPTEEELAHDFLWRIEQALPDAGHGRRLRPLALRGRAGRAGARARRRDGDRAPLRRHQRVREEARRRRHGGHQVHAAHLRRGAAASGCWPGSTTPRSSGSSSPTTSTSGSTGTTTSRPTRSRWSAATPTRRPGTSYRATTSGTATGPSGSCCSRRCAG